jgi:phosphoribosylamine--glycine ligase
MKVLVIGSGGREHALAWKLAQSDKVSRLYFAPGNPGMEALGKCVSIAVDDIQALRQFALREHIDLTVVGPEKPLSLGIVDSFQQAGLNIFGPSRYAAQLETSKHFAKMMMQQAEVPTAPFVYCRTEADALAALADFSPPYVIKQDGLAAGKGVTVTSDLAEARAAITEACATGSPVLLEGFLSGVELSVLAICDGQNAIPLVAARDFKRIGDGDTGPNTGGMGAMAPLPEVDARLGDRIQRQILQPMLAAMAEDGHPYQGVLYAGLMFSPEGALSVVEFNARFGDPETQAVLPLLEEDLASILLHAAQRDLQPWAAGGFRQASGRHAVTVVLASKGYPATATTGALIQQPATLPALTLLFEAATAQDAQGRRTTAGGRVLNVVGLGASVEEARQRAYDVCQQITFDGQPPVYRRDIAAGTRVSGVQQVVAR